MAFRWIRNYEDLHSEEQEIVRAHANQVIGKIDVNDLRYNHAYVMAHPSGTRDKLQRMQEENVDLLFPDFFHIIRQAMQKMILETQEAEGAEEEEPAVEDDVELVA